MTRPPKIDVDELGQADRIVYVRFADGKRYEHVFEGPITLSATTDGKFLILHGESLDVDEDGWIHG